MHADAVKGISCSRRLSFASGEFSEQYMTRHSSVSQALCRYFAPKRENRRYSKLHVFTSEFDEFERAIDFVVTVTVDRKSTSLLIPTSLAGSQ